MSTVVPGQCPSPPTCAQPTSRTGTPVDCAACRIRHLAVCAALGDTEVRALEAVASSLQLAPNATLVRVGEPRSQVYTVTAGALRLVRLLQDGRRQVAGFLLPGDFVGLSGAGSHRHDIVAVTDSTLCRFRSDDMVALRTRFPELERRLLDRAMSELDAARDQAFGATRLAPVEQLAGFLLEHAARQARWRATADAVLQLPMPRADIADHLGLTVETVSRSFTRLRASGLIALDDAASVRILDPAALAALAQATPAR